VDFERRYRNSLNEWINLYLVLCKPEFRWELTGTCIQLNRPTRGVTKNIGGGWISEGLH